MHGINSIKSVFVLKVAAVGPAAAACIHRDDLLLCAINMKVGQTVARCHLLAAARQHTFHRCHQMQRRVCDACLMVTNL